MKKRGTRTKLYRDRKGEWRWRTYAGNNRIVEASTEGYKNRTDCLKNAKRKSRGRIVDDGLEH